jgi:hypothetical protein
VPQNVTDALLWVEKMASPMLPVQAAITTHSGPLQPAA